MKYAYLILLAFFLCLPNAASSQAFKLEIRNQRVETYTGGATPSKELRFDIYMSRDNDLENLYLGYSDLRLSFNPANFSSPTVGLNQLGNIKAGYGPTAEVLEGNIISISFNTPNPSNLATDATNIAVAPAATFLGTFYIRNIIDNPGNMNLTWLAVDDAIYPTLVTKFLEFSPYEMVDISSSGQLLNPPSAFLTDLHVHFTGDGGADPNLYKIFVQSASQQSLPAGSIGFYVYYNNAKASLVYSTDGSISGASFNWGTGSTKGVETGPFANGFDRRFLYMHSDAAQNDDFWPAYVEGPGQGINIGAFRFNSTATEVSDPLNVVKFEPIDATSFSNYDATTNYTLTIEGATRPLGTANGTLPVTLTQFSAAVHPNLGVVLKWTTAMEKDNREFIVQRSSDAKTFTDVKTIPGAGNSNQTRHYNTTDDYPLPGTSYYRLLQADLDGTTTYSKVLAVKNNLAYSADTFIKAANPNPFQNRTAISFQLPADAWVAFTLSDALGKVISTDKMPGRAGANTYSLEGDHLANGIYFLTLNAGTESSRFKLVKNR